MNIVKHRYMFFLISLIVIIPGLVALGVWGLPLSHDFTGGSMLEVKFESGKVPGSDDVADIYNKLNIKDPYVQTSGNDIRSIRSKYIEEDTKNTIVAELEKLSGGKVEILQFETVGPSVGSEIASRAAITIALASIGILLYITWAFRGIPNAFRYGISAIAAMLHDVVVIIGFGSFFGHFLGWQVDTLFLTAVLTVIGYSVNDTVVIFDRIRENTHLHRNLPYETIVNHSIVQTFNRSLKTSFTVMLTLLALSLFGGSSINHFAITLFIGILSGTYSSIFNAAMILIVWENREWRWWFNKKNKPQTTAA
ncbi:MAG: protein translocase subunit SecF [Chloroflexi bacterium]|nr:protein translocase subunit SecF [Chloroflexota bacterium]BCY19021.1 protein-export membrane protein SecF [Leptolinea sp. HRD-7]